MQQSSFSYMSVPFGLKDQCLEKKITSGSYFLTFAFLKVLIFHFLEFAWQFRRCGQTKPDKSQQEEEEEEEEVKEAEGELGTIILLSLSVQHPKTLTVEGFATVLSQLLGINLGLTYDDVYNCFCPGSTCLMNPSAM